MEKPVSRLMITFLFLFIILSTVEAGGEKELFQETVDYVDMDRFTGPWYVIALLPTVFEKNAAGGIENYSIDEKGNIRVEYTFFKKNLEGKKVTMYQKGWILNSETNAEWEVQPLWPFRLPYLIIDLAKDYRYTVIGTDNYNYLWIMARKPSLSESDYTGILKRLELRGYDTSGIRIMPQM